MMPIQRNATVDTANQSTPATGILKLVGYTFVGLLILLGLAAIQGCTKQPRTYSLTVTQTIQIPPGTKIVEVQSKTPAINPKTKSRTGKTATVLLDAGEWHINVKGQSEDTHSPDVTPTLSPTITLRP